MAAALGPPVGGLLVEASWRWVFLVNLPIGLLALVFGPFVLRESKDVTTGVPDLLGAAGLLVGVGALTYSLVEAPDDGWGSVGVLSGFIVGAAGLVWAVYRASRHPVPVLDLVSLKVPTLWLACLGMLLFSAGFAAMVFGNVLFLTGIWHNSILVAGLSQSPGPLAVVATSILVGKLGHRVGPGPKVAVGGLSTALGTTLWLIELDATPDYFAGMLPGQLLTGIGVGLILPSLSAVVGTVLPPDRWGAGSSMINTSRQIGMVLGTAILVVVYGGAQDLTAFRHGWVFIVIVAVATALTGALLATRRNAIDHHRPVAEPVAA